MNKPINDIPSGTLFYGDPKYPVGAGLPAYSAGLGEGLYCKTLNGVVSVGRGAYWPTVSGFVVENYEAAPVEALLLIAEKRAFLSRVRDFFQIVEPLEGRHERK